MSTLHGGIYHLVHIVALGALVLALVTLVSSLALTLSSFLCWHNCPHCAGIAVMLVSLPLLRWCCCCLRHGLPRHLRLSTFHLNEGKDVCKSTAQCKHNKGKEVCVTRGLTPVHQGQQFQRDKGNDTSATVQTGQLSGGNNPVKQWWQCPCNLRAKRSAQ